MLTELETKLLGIMMMVIMLGMGASLTFKDFAIALRKPQGVFDDVPPLGSLVAQEAAQASLVSQ